MRHLTPKNHSTQENEVPGADRWGREDRSAVLRALLLATLVAGAFALARISPLADYLSASYLSELQGELAVFRRGTPVVFLLGGSGLIALGAPRSMISALAGTVFGLFWGVVLAMAATLLGSAPVFALTKLLGRPLFGRSVDKQLKIVEGCTKTGGLLIVVLLRQLPLTCMFVNILMGLTSIPMRVFIVGSVIGFLPETIIFALFGSSVHGNFVLRVSLASMLLVLLALGIRIYCRNSGLARAVAEVRTE